MNTLKTVNSHTRNAILNFIKNLVSKTTYRAIQLLLNPCCTYDFTSIDVACDPDNAGKYVITVTLAEPLNLLGKGFYQLNVAGTIVKSDVWPDSNTITVNNITSTAGDHKVGLTVVLPVSTTGVSGFVINTDNSPVVSPTFPSC